MTRRRRRRAPRACCRLRCARATPPHRRGRSPCPAAAGRRCSGRPIAPPRRSPRRRCAHRGAPRSGSSGRAGSTPCRPPTVRRSTPAGSAAPAPRPFRYSVGIRRAWWRRCSAIRRAPAPASACSRHRCRPRSAGADQHVQFVDEHDDAAGRRLDLGRAPPSGALRTRRGIWRRRAAASGRAPTPGVP